VKPSPFLPSVLNKLAAGEIETGNRVHDPVRFLHRVTGHTNREVTGLVAASLAFGRVDVMLRTLDSVFNILGPEPAPALQHMDIEEQFQHFQYRFISGPAMMGLLTGIESIVTRGPLVEVVRGTDPSGWASALRQAILDGSRYPAALDASNLLANPQKGSALKRWMLFFRWMVRKDAVDPGTWSHTLDPSDLVIPLDTHMARICRFLGLTQSSASTWSNAMRITDGFRRFCPEDPVRYDFPLAQLGIRGVCHKLTGRRKCISCPLQGVCTTGRMTVTSKD